MAKKYIYNITLNLNEILIDPTVADWADVTSDITIQQSNTFTQPGLTAWLGAKIKNMMKKSLLTSFALLLLALSACQKESDPSYKQEMEKDDAISFKVKEAEPFATKSSEDMPVQTYSQVIFSQDSLDIFLNMNESNYKADFFSESLIETKGVPYQDNNIGDFFVSAFFSDMQQFFSNAKLNSTDGSTVSTGYYWPLTTPATSLNFFGYAKKSANGQITKQNYVKAESASFSYALPDQDLTSADEQPDMLFAISPERFQTDGPVEMDFYHALSALAFSVGSVPGDLKIESVKFTNVYSSGNCTYTRQGDALKFEWSFGSGDIRKEYTQTFAKNLFTDGNIPLEEDTAINTAEQTFMMIPQTIGDDTKLEIKISFNGREYTIEKQLNQITSEWVPGKLYTFKISSPQEIEVQVTDEVVMDGIYPVKRNLQIKNTGIADAYIRVAIAGSWVVDHTTTQGTSQLIIADWKNSGDPDTDDGVFTWSSSQPSKGRPNSNFWRLGSDGYYYYMKLTVPGEILEPLFESYKLTASAPMSGAYLNLSILAQGVLDIHAEQLFPTEIKTDLGLGSSN